LQITFKKGLKEMQASGWCSWIFISYQDTRYQIVLRNTELFKNMFIYKITVLLCHINCYHFKILKCGSNLFIKTEIIQNYIICLLYLYIFKFISHWHMKSIFNVCLTLSNRYKFYISLKLCIYVKRFLQCSPNPWKFLHTLW
jgi:hypothetical protein